MNRESSLFSQKVIQVVQSIPKGKVASYGQVALYVGVPRAARQVGYIMKQYGEQMPWWRVINNKGRISIKDNWHADADIQKQLLEQEGVVVSNNYIVDIEQYRFKADIKLLKQWELPESYRILVITKYGI